MFGMGMPEVLLILAVALIVIGPKNLPDLAKSLGRAMGEFKRATNDFKETMQVDNELSQVKKAFDDMNVDRVSQKVDRATGPTDAEAGSDTLVQKPTAGKDALDSPEPGEPPESATDPERNKGAVHAE